MVHIADLLSRIACSIGAWVPDEIKKAYKQFNDLERHFNIAWGQTPVKFMRMILAAVVVVVLYGWCSEFNHYSQQMSWGMSNPSIMFKAQLRNGQSVIIDDYREAYHWLRDNTPQDARVLAWWDYGYQIAGIANRITIADGNTWNHEHIATLGKVLASEEVSAHKIARHIADYVLIWTGGGGDDLAKSPHMARIGNSVYHDICPGDPTCRQFGFIDRNGTPTPMMAASMLYKMHSHNQKPGVSVNPELFREVYTSKYNKVRIFKILKVSKKSRKWIADPKNRNCDAPGSWYCVGNYPPALTDLINNRTSFKQLEDFNTKRTAKDDEYNRWDLTCKVLMFFYARVWLCDAVVTSRKNDTNHSNPIHKPSTPNTWPKTEQYIRPACEPNPHSGEHSKALKHKLPILTPTF
jgi:dolichyl-diphosphooligosaccharide--protein glycosyltransferase